MKLVITIDCDNDSFQDGRLAEECIQVLGGVIAGLQEFQHGNAINGLIGYLYDTNGNKVGQAEFTD